MKTQSHFLGLALACVLAGPAQAATLTISESGRGWIRADDFNPATIDHNGNSVGNNYIAGTSNPGTYRNHFDFPIPVLSGTLQSAILSLDNPNRGGGTRTYSLYELGAYGTYAYYGIGAGTAYGSVSISALGTQAISLNGAALAAIGANQGGTFSLGGVNSGEGTLNQYDFGATSLPNNSTTLTLNYTPFSTAVHVVPVGNAGNAPDSTGFGAVAHNYRMGTTEVTNTQYAQFLNAKAASDPLGLYNANMGSDARGGITRSGTSGSYTYTLKQNMGDKPVNYVSWYDSVRFANWMNNGQGTGDTETGAYTLLGGTATPTNGELITRDSGAEWFLPNDDEWYKAAYYHPASLGGDSDDYWRYPTMTNSTPTPATTDNIIFGDIMNPDFNVANYGNNANWNGQTGNVTTVASAGPLSASFYGTYDQGGNVWEWNEPTSGGDRVLRGGSSVGSSSFLASSTRSGRSADDESFDVGFRVAGVPEPTTFALAAIGAVGLVVAAKRRRT